MTRWMTIAEHYEVSDGGNVRRKSGGAMLRPFVNAKGYHLVSISGVTRPVHRLVLEAFVGPRPVGQVARHLNGSPGDNRLANLAWGTRAENERDKREHGTVRLGRRHPMAKLDDDTIRIIRTEYRPYSRKGGSLRDLADRYGVDRRTVWEVIKGVTWNHVR